MMLNQPYENNVLEEPVKELNWNNRSNNIFYENLKIEGLKAFAEKAGLGNGCDMDVLKPYWSKAESILEVGAGYGRVVDYLLKHQFQGKVTALERCKVFIDYLNKQFSQYKNIHILPADTLHLNEKEDRFDLIVMLWSGLTDFPAEEQGVVIKNLARLLQKGGKLVIDMLPENVPPLISKKYSPQCYSLTVGKHSIYGFCPTTHETKIYAKEAGFLNIEHIIYKTDTLRERELHILY